MELESYREYLIDVLNGVSRSFVLIIPALEYPLDLQIGAAYAIFRVCDNIEDSQLEYPRKKELFSQLRILLQNPERADEILQRWGAADWPGLTERERALMSPEGGGKLWELYGKFEPFVRDRISRWAGEMVAGMEQFLAPLEENRFFTDYQGLKVIDTWENFDRYCYYVAGTVGFLCTELTSSHYQFSPQQLEYLNQRAVGFGRALQKINILKDFYKDLEERKISYIPLEWHRKEGFQTLELKGVSDGGFRELASNLLSELETGRQYIEGLPPSAEGYRFFTLGALLPAYYTLKRAFEEREKLFTPEHNCKISRTTMAKCLEDAGNYAGSDSLAELFIPLENSLYKYSSSRD